MTWKRAHELTVHQEGKRRATKKKVAEGWVVRGDGVKAWGEEEEGRGGGATGIAKAGHC